MHRRRLVATAAMTAVTALMVGACGGAASRKSTASVRRAGTMGDGVYSERPAPAPAAGTATDGVVSAGGTATATAARDATGATASTYAPAAAAGDTAGGTAPSPPRAVGLRAGSVDDNDRFADYLAYRNAFAPLGIRIHPFDVADRHIFTVHDRDGRPVLGADIQITDAGGHQVAELRTYADGRALWFPKATPASAAAKGPFTVKVTAGSTTATSQVDDQSQDHEHAITLDGGTQAQSTGTPVDVEFLVDATGSMDDEIAQLKQSLQSIAGRVATLDTKPDIRFALTVYRDRGDAFLTRTWNFSGDVAAFRQAIDGVQAGGGDDYPEDVQQGLHDALTKPSWRGPDAVKLVFLIGDAPPHLDYQDDPDYVADMVAAARQGIKIESLAASGLDDQGEYVWRQLAEATMGRFIFLTYGPDGGPGDGTTHHVDGYTPTNLEDLVVDVISHEAGAAHGSVQGGGGQ